MKSRVALYVLGLCAFSSGCHICHYETSKNLREGIRHRKLAQAAWEDVQKADPDRPYSKKYADGFKDGFAEYLCARGPGKAAVVPRRYRTGTARMPAGQPSIQHAAGYLHGSKLARARQPPGKEGASSDAAARGRLPCSATLLPTALRTCGSRPCLSLNPNHLLPLPASPPSKLRLTGSVAELRPFPQSTTVPAQSIAGCPLPSLGFEELPDDSAPIPGKEIVPLPSRPALGFEEFPDEPSVPPGARQR